MNGVTLIRFIFENSWLEWNVNMVGCGETILTLLLRYFTRHVIEAAVSKTEQWFIYLFFWRWWWGKNITNKMTEAENVKSSHSFPTPCLHNTGLKRILLNSHMYTIDLVCFFLENALNWVYCIFNVCLWGRNFKCCLETLSHFFPPQWLQIPFSL